jgi:uncharacterized phage protein (TIGR01671 family)
MCFYWHEFSTKQSLASITNDSNRRKTANWLSSNSFMNREIKFRAIDKKTKKVVFEGTLTDVRNAEGRLNFTTWEWLEYTGLKDKNGKEIYEGDIVKWFDEIGENPNLFKVEYDEAHWIIVPISETMDGWYLGNNVLEVIGNIYENPELLP